MPSDRYDVIIGIGAGDGTFTRRLAPSGKRILLLVLRGYPGYQCPLCTKQFADFRGKADAFKKAGARVVFVYPGPADALKDKAAEFVKGKDYPTHFTVLLDPDRVSRHRTICPVSLTPLPVGRK
jgi:peroxiredoxin